MTIVHELIARRMPQILGAYLVASWGLVQFAEFLESRYRISSGLVELVGLGLLLLLPSVLLVGYRHGRPGKDAWTRLEKIAVPVNLLLAAVALVVVFEGDAVGNVTRTIAVEDEDGTVQRREVPRDEYRRNVTLFFFENGSGDAKQDWTGFAVANLLFMDFYQDLYLNVGNPYASRVAFEEAGFPSGKGLPRALQRKIAADRHSQAFITGSVDRGDRGWSILAELYDTESGERIAQHEVTGEDLFDAADQVTDLLRHELDIPASLIASGQNFPVKDVFTASPIALRHYVEGQQVTWAENDYDAAIEAYRQALQTDPTFCAAAFQLFVALTVSQEAEAANEAMRTAMKHLYRVPERYALTVKANYFLSVEQDGERALAVSRMWVELYPQDIDAHTTLATFHQLRDEIDLAITELETILEIDPTQHRFRWAIADLYRQKGDFEGAEVTLRTYAEHFPNDDRSFRALAQLMEDFGRLEQAQQEIERAVLLEPEKASNLLIQARLLEKLGDFDAAGAAYVALLEQADSPRERMSAFEALQNLHEATGRLEKAILYRDQRYAEAQHVLMPIEATATQANDLELFVEAGRADEARRRLEELCAPLRGGRLEAVATSAELGLQLALGDTTGVRERMAKLGDFIQSSGIELMRQRLYLSQGQLAELAGDYTAAARAYEHGLHFDPNSARRLRDLARCYREMGEFAAAHELFEHSLRGHRSHPLTHYELALLHRDEGNVPGALEHLSIALEGWKQADAGFTKAAQAKKLHEELERSS